MNYVRKHIRSKRTQEKKNTIHMPKDTEKPSIKSQTQTQTQIPTVTTVMIGLKNKNNFQVVLERGAAVRSQDNRQFVPEKT